jgi:hypothetical protein
METSDKKIKDHKNTRQKFGFFKFFSLLIYIFRFLHFRLLMGTASEKRRKRKYFETFHTFVDEDG